MRQVVLVVDDDPLVLEMVHRMLIQLGHDSLMAEGEEEAIVQLERNAEIGVLLTDVVLGPGGNGFLLALRARARRPGLKVIYMSGYTGAVPSLSERVQGPLLRKPFRTGDLGSVLQSELATIASSPSLGR